MSDRGSQWQTIGEVESDRVVYGGWDEVLPPSHTAAAMEGVLASFTALEPGRVAKLSVYAAAATAGIATFYVAINGVSTGTSITLVDGDDAADLEYFPDPQFEAGDLIEVWASTNGSWSLMRVRAVVEILWGAIPPPVIYVLPYADVVMLDGPALYWRCGESSGSVAVDVSGNGRDGVIGANLTKGVPGLLVDDEDTAFHRSNISNFGRVLRAHETWMHSNDMSFEAWVNITSVDSSASLMGIAGQFDIYHDGRPAFQRVEINLIPITGSGSTAQSPLLSAPTGTTLHIVATYNSSAGVLKCYVNNVLVINASHPNGIKDDVVQDLLFGPPAGTTVMDMDEFAVYTFALTADQVEAHYNAGLGLGSLEGLALYLVETAPDLWAFGDQGPAEAVFVETSPNNYAIDDDPEAAGGFGAVLIGDTIYLTT